MKAKEREDSEEESRTKDDDEHEDDSNRIFCGCFTGRLLNTFKG